jgi:NADPH:quinone reductase-like Zn-dependent oxidoreductase
MNPQLMKAATYSKYGPPEVVSITSIPKPVAKPNQVLIKVHASTVNRTDCGFRSAEYFVVRFFSGLVNPKNPVLGCEFAGVVEAVGSTVTRFAVGDKVFGYNEQHFGGHAQYLTMEADGAMAHIPENFTFEQAAPLTEGVHYALNQIRSAKVVAGQHVLVYGATGAIGSAAVQLLKQFGAHVTAVCHTQYLERIKVLGADVVLDYTCQDYTQSGQTFDFVLDAVGKTSFGTCKPVLKPKGIYISTELGKHWENVWLPLFAPFMNKKVRFPIPTINQQDVAYFKQLAETGAFKPLLDKQFALDDIVEAYRYVETGMKVGNVVVTVCK